MFVGYTTVTGTMLALRPVALRLLPIQDPQVSSYFLGHSETTGRTVTKCALPHKQVSPFKFRSGLTQAWDLAKAKAGNRVQ